ncbi:cysteine proteinase, partial [Patellaria atrata CBS 101060]
RYLERNELEKEANKSAQIVLLRPSMAVLLMSSPDPQSLRSALPNFEQITHIFLPINDANNYDVTSSGTHWSLLVVSKLDGVAFHYDSMEPANIKYAKAAATKLSELLQTPLHFHEMNDCPQQDNGSDCGVFVCVAMEELLIRLLNVERAQKITMSMENRIQDKNLNSNMRTKLMKIIQGLVEQEKKRK